MCGYCVKGIGGHRMGTMHQVSNLESSKQGLQRVSRVLKVRHVSHGIGYARLARSDKMGCCYEKCVAMHWKTKPERSVWVSMSSRRQIGFCVVRDRFEAGELPTFVVVRRRAFVRPRPCECKSRPRPRPLPGARRVSSKAWSWGCRCCVLQATNK